MFDSLNAGWMVPNEPNFHWKILEIPWATKVPHVGQGTTGERADGMVGNLDLVTVFQTLQS